MKLLVIVLALVLYVSCVHPKVPKTNIIIIQPPPARPPFVDNKNPNIMEHA